MRLTVEPAHHCGPCWPFCVWYEIILNPTPGHLVDGNTSRELQSSLEVCGGLHWGSKCSGSCSPADCVGAALCREVRMDRGEEGGNQYSETLNKT